MAAVANQLTNEQKEFIVRKLAAFYTPRDIAQQLAAKFVGAKVNENDILATDPRVAIVSPELFMLYRAERERVLLDPSADPYTDQKARLILLSNMVDRYKDNNQFSEARSVMQQIASELGIGAKAGAPGKVEDKTVSFKELTVKRTVVRPPEKTDG